MYRALMNDVSSNKKEEVEKTPLSVFLKMKIYIKK